jgi:predicted SpoU family rRNA methylase
MFAVLTYSNGVEEDMGLSIGIRNSYDKSMSIGVALGARVFVCDNLAISGEIRIVRKHTAGVWKAIEDMAISTLYRHRPA